MKKFLDKDFMLTNETACHLFHDYAENLPIIDYHCHINPREIAEDKKYEDMWEVWLGGDHYKWRAIRSNGVDEKYILGDASHYEKFLAFAEALPKMIGNPLYHWSHLELKKYFGIEEPLCKDNAKKIWDICNERLKDADMSARGIIKASNVKLICTTDDPIDDLQWHEAIAADQTFDTKVLPAWRPDKGLNVDKEGYGEYIEKLEKVVGFKIEKYNDLEKAFTIRLDYFEAHGCVAADHGLDYVPFDENYTEEELDRILAESKSGKIADLSDTAKFKTALLQFFGKEYNKRNWVMQIHFGVSRNNNRKMMAKYGPDTGFDAIGGYDCVRELTSQLDLLASKNDLPKTIVYSINPGDNAAVGTMLGCFQTSGACGRIQQGSGWWFNDNKTGMQEQMTSLANLGLLGNFVGMLTDSRSFLSYTRHDYFRRIMCDLIGRWVENGEYPNDDKLLKELVENISYYNTNSYFGFNL